MHIANLDFPYFNVQIIIRNQSAMKAIADEYPKLNIVLKHIF